MRGGVPPVFYLGVYLCSFYMDNRGRNDGFRLNIVPKHLMAEPSRAIWENHRGMLPSITDALTSLFGCLVADGMS